MFQEQNQQIWKTPSKTKQNTSHNPVTATNILEIKEQTMIDKQLLAMLVCPVSQGELIYRTDTEELWCKKSKLAYPIKDDIPVMLEHEARQLTLEEYESIKDA